MKKLIAFSLLVSLFSCQEEKQGGTITSDDVTVTASAKGRIDADLPEITFDEPTFDFGKITQGERVTHSFSFTNTGETDLIVSGANASCGCTVPGWPKEPIPPGGKGEIDVVFSSESKSGYQEKTITVVTNCEPATRVLRIKAMVIVPETPDK
jgi:hypothetical protein